jgi:hypothetical protein
MLRITLKRTNRTNWTDDSNVASRVVAPIGTHNHWEHGLEEWEAQPLGFLASD